MVKNYESKTDRFVLELVKKYPLYSVEKLKLELPEISRHSIQRILEKHQLSKIEQRLAFASDQQVQIKSSLTDWKTRIFSFLGSVKARWVNLDIFKQTFKKVRENPRTYMQLAGRLVIFLAIALILWRGSVVVFSNAPQISLEKPEEGYTNSGQKLFVSGRVEPKSALVRVNDKEASLNGDGTFTALIDISVGQSEIKVEALNRINRAKKSQVLRLVNRVLTEGELQAKETEEARVQREAADKSAQIERTVNDLLAVKNATSDKNSFLKVLNSRIKEEGGFAYVEGEISNLGKENASWVMITTTFYNNAGAAVDTKYGFATDFGRVIKPGETTLFETQRTTKKFDYYSLAVSSEREAVAGATTETGGTNILPSSTPTQLPARPSI